MNELSWLLYAADAAGSIRCLALMALLAGTAGVFASYWGDKSERASWDEGVRDHKRYPSLYPKSPEGERPAVEFPMAMARKPGAATAAICATLLIVVPGSDTLHAIAASQIGEKVITSPSAQKAVQALNAWLDRQIKKSD